MLSFLRSTTIVATLSLFASPVLSQDGSQQARNLLVEAVRAAHAADAETDPAKRFAALRDAVAALDKIEADHASTDIGLTLITGGTFNLFDPAAVRDAHLEAKASAETASCEETFTPACTYRLRNEMVGELEDMTAEEAQQEFGASDRLVYLVAIGDMDGAADFLNTGEDGERSEAIVELYNYGYSLEMLDLFDSLPADDEVRAEVPTRAEFIELLPEIIDGRNAVQEPIRQRALQRLIDAGIEGLEPTILAKGSPMQIADLVGKQRDVEESVSQWIERNWVRPGSDGAIYLAGALDGIGESDLALPLISTTDSFTNEHVTYQAPRLLSPETFADYLEVAAPRISNERMRAALLWDAVAVLSAQEFVRTVDQLDLQPRAALNTQAPFDAGIEAGRNGQVDKLELVKAAPQGLFKPKEVEAFSNGMAVGLLVAKEPSGDAFEAAISKSTGDDQAELMFQAASLLVSEGRIEDAIGGLRASGFFNDSDASIDSKTRVAATVGDLEWLIDALRKDRIDSSTLEGALRATQDYITAARKHDYDTTDTMRQVAQLIATADDQFIKSMIARMIALPNRFGYDGAGDLLYAAAQDLSGYDKASALVFAHSVSSFYRER